MFFSFLGQASQRGYWVIESGDVCGHGALGSVEATRRTRDCDEKHAGVNNSSMTNIWRCFCIKHFFEFDSLHSGWLPASTYERLIIRVSPICCPSHYISPVLRKMFLLVAKPIFSGGRKCYIDNILQDERSYDVWACCKSWFFSASGIGADLSQSVNAINRFDPYVTWINPQSITHFQLIRHGRLHSSR
jgi:hypothetical protein